MFLTMMGRWRREVRAARAGLMDERGKPQPNPGRISELEACERRAMNALILGQIWWGPYWAVADLWSSGDSRKPAARPPQDDGERIIPRTPVTPMLMAAE